MSVYYANEMDEYLAHYGVKGMKWGKHVMTRDPDYLRRIRDILVEKKLRKKEQEYNTNKSPNRPTKRAEDYRPKRKSGSVRKRGKALNLGGPVGDSRGRRKRK